MPFQTGFLISITSLLGLSQDMSAVELNYILTAKLNEDCLENLFSQVHSIGGANANLMHYNSNIDCTYCC